LSVGEYQRTCDPWPLNPDGELLLGFKVESREGVARCEEILAVPGIGFAEMGAGDLGLSLGYLELPRDPLPPEMAAVRERVFASGRTFGVTFFGSTTSETVGAKLDEGVQNIGGRSEEVARPGRAYSARVRTARPERP
jgi:4-hydroxy-2-oxoheptanedioate aldolase